MERTLKHDNLWRSDPFSIAISSRQFDRRLVGFCARIAEEHILHAGCVAEHLGHLLLQADMEQVRCVHQARDLFGNGGRHPRVVVSQVSHRDARNAVQISPPVGVVEQSAFSMREGHGQSTVGRHNGVARLRHWNE